MSLPLDPLNTAPISGAAEARRILQLGLDHHSEGRFDQARSYYEQVLTVSPNHFDALHMMGVLAIQTRRPKEAVALIERAILQKPGIASAQRNYALALREAGRKQEAVEAYTRAIVIEPTYVASYVDLAETLVDLGQPMLAVLCCDRGLQNCGQDPALHLARAVSLRGCERLEEALASCDTAIFYQPGYTEAWDKRGATLQALGRLDEAQESYSRAIELQPDFDLARYHSGMLHLQTGRLSSGWTLHECREQAQRDFGRPRWPVNGPGNQGSVLIHSEQGLGDTVQFCRYALEVAAEGARVTLMVQQPLLGVMQTLGRHITVIADTPDPPPTDFQCPLMSLPLVFGTSLRTIPAPVPYLAADPERVISWRQRLGPAGFKLGICWRGSNMPSAVGKDFPVTLLQSIARVPDIRLVSLQKGAGVEQLRDLPQGVSVEDLGSDFDSGATGFLDTVAVMESLDLIITCDTSVAHLAGALGRPTWIALKHVSDWRWLTERSDTPWYPTVCLFRQPRAGDWSAVFDSMLARLLLQMPARAGVTQR